MAKGHNNMETVWDICAANTRLQQKLSSELGMSDLFAQLLINRGIKDPDEAYKFLFGDLATCHNPFLMKDMEKGVERIKKAILAKEKVMIHGDYDVDGLTSTALLSDLFCEIGIEHEAFIPNRLDDGYGLSEKAVDQAEAHGVKLLITVDCGINSVSEVAYANSKGIDVIITDHHVPKEDSRPEAYAIIDPHQTDCEYPFKYLAGVGVAYKLARALMRGQEEIVDKYLDLVAIGTVADIVPAVGENRILTKIGLKKLRSVTNTGLKALMDITKLDPEKLTCRHIGFVMGPRINAMGRVGSADVSLDLLLCKDIEKAKEIARIMDGENKNRQSIQNDIFKQAMVKVDEEINLNKDKVIVLAEENWHPGVIGIVASKLTEEYSKPAILIATEGNEGKGSGRSIEGFNLLKAIGEAGEHLVGFGGHKAACGITIEKDKVEQFREVLNEKSGKYFPEDGPAVSKIKIDIEIPFSYINLKLINELNMLMPYGVGNEEPVFCTRGITVKNRPRDIGRSGFKFLATCGPLTCEVVTFRKNSVDKPRQGDVIDLAYTPSINSWGGVDTIQLNIRNLRIL